MIAGTAFYYALVTVTGGVRSALVGALPSYGAWLERMLTTTSSIGLPVIANELVALLPHVASIAIVASIFALLAAKVVDQATHRRHDGNRELIAQGFANVASGGFGGIPVSGLPSQSLMAWRVGASGRIPTLIACLAQLAVLEFAAHWIGYLPAAALAGVMVVTGFDLFDHWSMRLLANLRREDTHRPTIAAELAIVVLVAALIVAGYLVTAVVLGIVIAAIVFISRMSRKVVRQRSTGRLRRSRRRRVETMMQRLREIGDRIVVFDMIPSPASAPSWFVDIDHALEWCEDRLLEETQDVQATDGEIAFAQVDLCAGLGAAEIARLERVLTRREHPKGSALFRRGDGGDELFVLLKGAVSCRSARAIRPPVRADFSRWMPA